MTDNILVVERNIPYADLLAKYDLNLPIVSHVFEYYDDAIKYGKALLSLNTKRQFVEGDPRGRSDWHAWPESAIYDMVHRQQGMPKTDEDGNFIVTENPDGHFRSYSVGSHSMELILKNGECTHCTALSEDIDWDAMFRPSSNRMDQLRKTWELAYSWETFDEYVNSVWDGIVNAIVLSTGEWLNFMETFVPAGRKRFVHMMKSLIAPTDRVYIISINI